MSKITNFLELSHSLCCDISMKLKTPSIFNYFTAPAYLSAFFELNKSEVPDFSHRVFANAIDWPASYLSDVTNGRKKLTILRAVQFARFANLNSIETERLIYFSMESENDPAVQDFSKKRLLGTCKDEAKTSTIDYDAFKNIDIGAVFATLVWAKKRISNQEIKSLLYTLPDLDNLRITNIVNWLEQNKLVVFDEVGNMTYFAPDLHLDEQTPNPEDSGVRIHELYARSFIQFTQKAQSPCMYNSGFVEIPRKNFMQVAQKILEVRNWIIDCGKEANQASKENIHDSLVFQFDMNLFSAFDKATANSMK